MSLLFIQPRTHTLTVPPGPARRPGNAPQIDNEIEKDARLTCLPPVSRAERRPDANDALTMLVPSAHASQGARCLHSSVLAKPPSLAPRMQAASTDMKVLLVVAVALLRRDPETHEPSVLLAQRPAGKSLAGMWEFPGGKLEPGERPEQALRRELVEELDIDVQIDALQPLTFASHTYAEQGFHLLMPLFVCTAWEGDPVGAEGQELTWSSSADLESFAMPAADVPLIPAIRRALADM